MNTALGPFLRNMSLNSSHTSLDTYLGYRLITPVILWFVPQLQEHVRRIYKRVVQSVASSFKYCNSDIGILTQTGSNNKACSSSPDYDIVV